ncbi:DUF1837 domain-containing protein [Cytobacillus oceanisediminis]|uniref:Anti-bacteriophage protein A/HamA C-terminal domain-containing protein n=1 Tax=Cytobacillus oceanisediminis 2691 TaxID=1196031 RepID=A0A160M795_9BACI|nr:DUF1837 domain-containing protein [Cytobacillus oceanisediminis]AND37808.1 hypothetical protein A361_01065 [Cytobacillus oceanisediminis 2691]
MASSTQASRYEDIIERYIASLLRGKGEELNSYLVQVESNQTVVGTKAITRCYMVKSNAQTMPRVEDLALRLADFMIDYAIPRSEIKKAKNLDSEENTTLHTSALARKARKLFTKLKKTGEGGELLLYLLIQSVLRLPQVISKMSLKTSNQMHYQGADAVHMGYDASTQKLQLYWGEAKLYQSLDQAITNCFKSLSPYLISPGGAEDPRERDMQLLLTNLDLANSELETAILNYLDPHHPSYNLLEYRGACLIGFDSSSYCKTPFDKTQEIVMEELKSSLTSWLGKINSGITKHQHLNKFTLEVFLVPFPSVQDFRDKFLEAIS